MEKQLYAKIFKWLSIVLLVVSVVLTAWAFTKFNTEAEDGAVTLLLNWAYVMLGLVLASVLCVGLYITATTQPKNLIKIGLVLVGVLAVVAVAYVLASGAQPIGFNGTKPPTDTELKLTDTVLNLAYILGGAAILAIVVNELAGLFRSKKA